MRVFFVVCFMASVFAVTAPMAADTETVSVSRVSAPQADALPTARPVAIAIELTPPPTLRPPEAPAAKAPPILKPKHAVAPVPPPKTSAPTPKPTAKPTAAPTAKPKATAAPTAKPRPSPTGGTTYTRQQVIAGIKAGWGGDDAKAIDVADCESSLNPRAGSGTYLGLWQFHIETWRNYGGTGDPRDHSPQTQTEVAWNVFQDYGWDAWPGCA